MFIIFVALFPGVFTKNDPNYCTLDNSLEPARPGHPFGFDLQGCDVYSRVIYGTRTSLSVGILSTLIVVAVGTLIGAIAGFCGGWIDAVLSRIVDIFMAIPMLLGAIVVLQMFRTITSIWKVVLVLALFGWVSTTRIARGAVLSSKNLEFNTASTALGSTPMRNLFRHILPNTFPVLLSAVTIGFNNAVLSEASMSFLGIGIQPPYASLGSMLSDSQSFLHSAPWYALGTGGAIVLLILGFSLLSEGLQLKGQR